MEEQSLPFAYEKIIPILDDPPKLRLTTYLGSPAPLTLNSLYPEGQVAVLGPVAQDIGRRMQLNNGKEGPPIFDSPLQTLVLPESLELVERGAFSKCRSLRIVNLLACHKAQLEPGVFQDCYGLHSAFLPAHLTTLGEKLFCGCPNLRFVKIPPQLTAIEKCAFFGCKSLKLVDLPQTLNHIGKSSFSYCLGLTQLTLPLGVTQILDQVFSMCVNLTNITLHQGVTSIGMHAFKGCEALESIHLPEGLLSIGEGAFVGCDKLKDIEIPSSVTIIGPRAFPPEAVPEHPRYVHHIQTAFYKKDALAHTIHLIKKLDGLSGQAYQDLHAQLQGAQDLLAHTLSIQDAELLSLILQHQLLSYSMAGTLLNQYDSRLEIASMLSVYRQDFEHQGMDQEEDPFAEMTLMELSLSFDYRIRDGGLVLYNYHGPQTDVVVPDTVERLPVIRVECLGRNDQITSLIFGRNIPSLGYEACAGFTKLSKVILPSQLKAIGQAAFSGCKSLSSIDLPSTCTFLDEYAFHGCVALQSIQLPKGTKHIPRSAFSHCSNLRAVVLPDGLQYIAEAAFRSCSSLRNIRFPEGMSAHHKAFEGAPVEHTITWISSDNPD